jgi:CRP-like cAMP-binding protein
VPWLPSLRGTVVVSVMLVGAYGVDAGLAATALLLMAYAAVAGVKISVRNFFKWVTSTRRRAVVAVKLLDDRNMKTFQRVTLQIFDLPHHPRRLRQAVRRWRTWRENHRENNGFFGDSGVGNASTRGDGLGALHDLTSTSAHGTAGTPRFGFGGEFGVGSIPGGDAQERVSETFSLARAAFSQCDLAKQLPPDVLKALCAEHMREVHVAAGEDVFRGRVRDDELAVLVSGSVVLGEFSATHGGYAGDEEDTEQRAFFKSGGATVITRPGVVLNSLLDVLEGSEHAHEHVSTRVNPQSPLRNSWAGGKTDSKTDPSLNPFGDDQLMSAAATAAASTAKAAAEAANELANEAVLDSFKPAASPSRLSKAGNADADEVLVGAGPGLTVRVGPSSDATHTNPSGPLGVVAVALAAAREDDDAASTEAELDVDDDAARAPTASAPTTPTRARVQTEVQQEDGVRNSVSNPGTPNRVGRAVSKDGNGERNLDGGGFGAPREFGPAPVPPNESLFAASDFSGGPGGLPRLRARGGANGGCVIAAVPLRAFHAAAGFQLGIQAPTMRLSGGYHALCHYFRAPHELGALWVDPPPHSTPASGAGATLALVRLLGAEAARAVDRGALETLLERRGYRPRRAPVDSWRPDEDMRGDSEWDEAGSGGSRDDMADDDVTSSRASSVTAGLVARTGGGGGPGGGARHSHRESSASRAGGSGSNSTRRLETGTQSQPVSVSNSQRGGSPVELEAVELAPGERLRFRSTAAAALLVERGSLEGYWTPLDARDGDGFGARTGSKDARVSSIRSASNRTGHSKTKNASSSFQRERGPSASHERHHRQPPAFTAHPGSVVGEFMLLTGQRAAVTIRAGPNGCVVAALPHSAVARLVRTYPATYARVATRIARRLRPALPAKAWDRCGVQWISLGAGQSLADHQDSRRRALAAPGKGAPGFDSRINAHADGVYVVVTGCVRLSASGDRGRVGGVGSNPGRGGPSQHDPVDGNGGGSGQSAWDDEFASAQQPPRFLGPGDAVGEEVILRDAFGNDGFGDGGGGGGGSRALRELSRATAAALGRARAVRETQLLWIPAAGLEALATSAPRAFAALAWRMGARAGASAKATPTANARVAVDGGDGFGFGVDSGVPGVAKSGSAGAGMFGAMRTPTGIDRDTAQHAPRTVAVVPVSEGAALALDEFCAATLAALVKSCHARVADSASRLAEVGQAGVGPLAHEATAHWLAQLESANDVVLLKADPFPSPWCAQCARHADCILLVCAAEDVPPSPEEGRNLQARLLGGGVGNLGGGGLAQRELVVLHGSAEIAPTGTRAWLEAFSVHRHHHLARAPAHGLAPAHASRLARSLRKQSVGLVLAGGGARGFAHVGVLMALEEEGVPVDMLGGTSMGSFVGGIYAKEPTALLTRIIARRLAVHMSSAWEQLLDLTLPYVLRVSQIPPPCLPIVQSTMFAHTSPNTRLTLFFYLRSVVSYFSGFRMNKALEPLFRNAKIEDCWLPFFCVTLDLISCVTIVHRNGTLWRYVRASMALVGFLPPVCDRAPVSSGHDKGNTGKNGKGAYLHCISQIQAHCFTEAGDCCPYIAIYKTDTFLAKLQRPIREQPNARPCGRRVREQPADGRDARRWRAGRHRGRRQRKGVTRNANETLGRRDFRGDHFNQKLAAAVARGRAHVSDHGANAGAPALRHGLRQRRAKSGDGYVSGVS